MSDKKNINAIGVLVVNLGTPEQVTPGAIRKFLKEFLSDPRVVEIPAIIWKPLLNAVILPFRPSKLVHKYESIWLENGGPLKVYSQDLQSALAQNLAPQNVIVRLAMRYGQPAIHQELNRLREQGCERVLIVPMYPQYAASTTATIVDCVGDYQKKQRAQLELRFINDYATDAPYINALVKQIRDFWQGKEKPQKLVLSFHGIPQRSVDLGDPYAARCEATTAAIKAALGEDGHLVDMTYQSRFGRAKWLTPYTQNSLETWAKQGIHKVDIMCPGFLADCLETLEEIQVECADAFKQAGGTQYRYIPCLNAQTHWVAAMQNIITKHLQGWL